MPGFVETVDALASRSAISWSIEKNNFLFCTMEFIEKMGRVEDGGKSDDMEHDGEEVRNYSNDGFIGDDNESQYQRQSDYRLRSIATEQQEASQDLSMGENWVLALILKTLCRTILMMQRMSLINSRTLRKG